MIPPTSNTAVTANQLRMREGLSRAKSLTAVLAAGRVSPSCEGTVSYQSVSRARVIAYTDTVSDPSAAAFVPPRSPLRLDGPGTFSKAAFEHGAGSAAPVLCVTEYQGPTGTRRDIEGGGVGGAR